MSYITIDFHQKWTLIVDSIDKVLFASICRALYLDKTLEFAPAFDEMSDQEVTRWQHYRIYPQPAHTHKSVSTQTT